MGSPKLTLYVDTVSPFAYEAYYILRASSFLSFALYLVFFLISACSSLELKWWFGCGGKGCCYLKSRVFYFPSTFF